MLEKTTSHFSYCLEHRRNDLQQREALQLKALSESRQQKLRKYEKFAESLNQANCHKSSLKTRQQSACSNAAL